MNYVTNCRRQDVIQQLFTENDLVRSYFSPFVLHCLLWYTWGFGRHDLYSCRRSDGWFSSFRSMRKVITLSKINDVEYFVLTENFELWVANDKTREDHKSSLWDQGTVSQVQNHCQVRIVPFCCLDQMNTLFFSIYSNSGSHCHLSSIIVSWKLTGYFKKRSWHITAHLVVSKQKTERFKPMISKSGTRLTSVFFYGHLRYYMHKTWELRTDHVA